MTSPKPPANNGRPLNIPTKGNAQTDMRWIPDGMTNQPQMGGGYPYSEAENAPYVDPRLTPLNLYVALRDKIAAAAGSLLPDTRRAVRTDFLASLDAIVSTGDEQTLRYISGTIQQKGKYWNPDGARVAATMIASQREIAANAAANARAALDRLRPVILRETVPGCPDGASDADVRDRRDEVAAAIGAASGVAQRNMVAQQILRDAMRDGDSLTVHAELSDAFKFKAQTLGLSLDKLRQVYAKARYETEGDHPLMGGTPGAALVATCWDDLDAVISAAEKISADGIASVEALLS